KKRVAGDPANGAPAMQLAYHYHLLGRTAEADAIIDGLTSRPQIFRNGRSQAGDFFVRVREDDKALAQLELGRKEQPKNARPYQKKIVEVLGVQGKQSEAEQLLAELLASDPKDPETIALHGTFLLQRGDPNSIAKAVAEMKPLLTKMPG